MLKYFFLSVLIFGSVTAYSADEKDPKACSEVTQTSVLSAEQLEGLEATVQTAAVSFRVQSEVFSRFFSDIFVNGEFTENYRDPMWVAEKVVVATRFYVPAFKYAFSAALTSGEVKIPDNFQLEQETQNSDDDKEEFRSFIYDLEAAELVKELAKLISGISKPDLSLIHI